MSDCGRYSADTEDASTEESIVDPSDLLVRLRDAAFDADDMLINDVKALFKEAADEIEKLRGLVGSRRETELEDAEPKEGPDAVTGGSEE